MPKVLSAIDAVTPAFEQTKQQLFKPIRVGRWARLALVSLVTGEFAGGGWGGGGNFNLPESRGKQDLSWLTLLEPPWGRLVEYLPWILLGVFVLIALTLLWFYAASVYRFILFDSVLNDRCELRAGWHRWKREGSSYFLFTLGLGLAIPAVLLLVIGGPIFFAWRSGIFREPKEHLALLIIGGVVLFFVLVGVIVAAALVGLLAKDFAVPIMALENLSILDAWRVLLPMLGAEKLSYAGYVLMKIVLAVGSAIIFGIITLLVILALLIPLGIGSLGLYFIAKAAGLGWNLATISVAAVLGGAVLLALLYVIALISTPAMVFFQSYALHFFGSRYPGLGALLFPSPPEPIPAAGA